MITNDDLNHLESHFESIINNQTLLVMILKEKIGEEQLEQSVREAYYSEGFPPDLVVLDNLNYDVVVEIDNDPKTFSTLYATAYEDHIESVKESGQTIDKAYNEDDLLNFIFEDNSEDVDFEIKIKDDLQDFMQENLTIDVFEKAISREYDEEKLREAIVEIETEDYEFEDKINEAKDAVGIDPEVSNHYIDYDMTDIKPLPFSEIAEALYPVNESLNYYFDGQFYHDLVNKHLVSYNIIILNDKEDIKEQQNESLETLDDEFVDEVVDTMTLESTIRQEFVDEIEEERKHIITQFLSNDLSQDSDLVDEIVSNDDLWNEYMQEPSNYDNIIETFKDVAKEHSLIGRVDLVPYLLDDSDTILISNQLVAIGVTSEPNKYTYIIELEEDEVRQMIDEREDYNEL